MACPHVSGGAALVLEANPSMKSSAVLQQLLDDAYLNVLSDLKFGDTNALLCVAEGGAPPTPTPQPTPAPPPGTWVVTGSGCRETNDCVQSLNYGTSNYGNNEACTIQLSGSVSITVRGFSTEAGYDILTMGGRSYSGTSGPSSGSYTGVITWASDYSVVGSGWKLCKAQGGGGGPSPTPSPSPAPSPTPPSGCTNLEANCDLWADAGYCSSSSQYYEYMQANCCASCSGGGGGGGGGCCKWNGLCG